MRKFRVLGVEILVSQLFKIVNNNSIGSAWLIRHKKEDKKYVAKKIILEGLSNKEQEGCMLEVNLLKNLDHPNIVAYKESFLSPG